MSIAADLEIKKAAQLSLTEIGLGSIGHGFKIPLAGQILSLNQLAFLLNAVNSHSLPKSSTFEISGIAAVLKSFSPAGQKIGPMMSIASQGFLFWLGISVLGLNLAGQLIGALMLSLWAFVQPLLTLFLIYGSDIAKLSEYYQKKMGDDFNFLSVTLFYAVIGIIVLKILIAAGMVLFSFTTKKEIKILNESQVDVAIHKNTSSNPAKAALRDLLRPLFLLSFVLMLIFTWQLNGTLSEKIWMAMRPLATAFVIFYILRSPRVAGQLLKLAAKSERFARIHAKAQKVLNFVAERSAGSSEISSR